MGRIIPGRLDTGMGNSYWSTPKGGWGSEEVGIISCISTVQGSRAENST